MRTTIAWTLFAAFTLAPGVAAAGDEVESLEELVVEMANTPADHAALARYYRAKAVEARAAAADHQGMGRAYGGGKLAERQRMQEHCKKLAADSTEVAAEYDALAKIHEAEAKKATP